MEELGPNILLAWNIRTIGKELKIWKDQGFFEANNSLLFDPVFTDFSGDFELPDFETPSFELPDFF